jgi:hypothetical protein
MLPQLLRVHAPGIVSLGMWIMVITSVLQVKRTADQRAEALDA